MRNGKEIGVKHAAVGKKVVSKHTAVSGVKEQKAAQWRSKQTQGKREKNRNEFLATYSGCHNALCYHEPTWGRTSRWWAKCPTGLGTRRMSCRHRPGKLPPAAEKPTYVCYLAVIAYRKQELQELWPNGIERKTRSLRKKNFYWVLSVRCPHFLYRKGGI